MQIPYSGLFFQKFLFVNGRHITLWTVGSMEIFIILCSSHYVFTCGTWAQVDFKPVLQELLTTHPGLEFLQNTPEFQERYGRLK